MISSHLVILLLWWLLLVHNLHTIRWNTLRLLFFSGLLCSYIDNSLPCWLNLMLLGGCSLGRLSHLVELVTHCADQTWGVKLGASIKLLFVPGAKLKSLLLIGLVSVRAGWILTCYTCARTADRAATTVYLSMILWHHDRRRSLIVIQYFNTVDRPWLLALLLLHL